MPPKRIGRSTSQARKKRALRASETLEQREARLETVRACTAQAWSIETLEQREERLNIDRERTAEARFSETPEQRETRLETVRTTIARLRQHISDLNLGAFRYNAAYDYSLHTNVVIGKMDKLCDHCNALKFSNETRGMCCAGGKVKLPQLNPPHEPLSTLISGDIAESKHFLANICKYNSCFQMTSYDATNIVRDNYMPTF